MNFSQQTKIMDFVEDKVHFDNLSYDILDEIVFHLSAIERMLFFNFNPRYVKDRIKKEIWEPILVSHINLYNKIFINRCVTLKKIIFNIVPKMIDMIDIRPITSTKFDKICILGDDSDDSVNYDDIVWETDNYSKTVVDFYYIDILNLSNLKVLKIIGHDNKFNKPLDTLQKLETLEIEGNVQDRYLTVGLLIKDEN